jgi:hypothetical protein
MMISIRNTAAAARARAAAAGPLASPGKAGKIGPMI